MARARLAGLLSTSLFLILGVGARAAWGLRIDYDTVDLARPLSTYQAALNATAGGSTHLRFAAYSKPGALQLDNSYADSVIFERSDTLADSVIPVTGTFLSVKGTAGVVLLRGLAFKLMDAQAKLIDGANLLAPNGKLILDSCIVYGDALGASGFLAWQGKVKSAVEIRRCLFVAKSGPGAMSLACDTLRVRNNLFNAPMDLGLYARDVLDLSYNTFSRTYLRVSGSDQNVPGDVDWGVANVSKNLFLYPKPGQTPGAQGVGAFQDLGPGSVLAGNYRTASFDIWDLSKRMDTATNDATGKLVGIPPATEAWNWYVADTARGFANGPDRMPAPYNLFPAKRDTTVTFAQLGGKGLRLFADLGEIPRHVDVTVDSSRLEGQLANSASAFWSPAYPLRIGGPVRVDSAQAAGFAVLGRPALLYQDSTGNWRATDTAGSRPASFTFPPARTRTVLPIYFGNTPRGSKVAGPATAGDSVAFSFNSVSQAGQSTYRDAAVAQDYSGYRLLKSIGFTTSAVADTVTFRYTPAKADPVPVDSAKVHWVVKPGTAAASVSKANFNGGKYSGQAAFATGHFQAYLVEDLTVTPGADVRYDLDSGDYLQVTSAHGLTLKVYRDKGLSPASVYKPGSPFNYLSDFGQGYAFTFSGLDTAAGDRIQLVLRQTQANPTRYLYRYRRVADSTLTQLGLTSEEVITQVTVSDSSLFFFLANANSIPWGLYRGTINQIAIDSLISDRPGSLALTILKNPAPTRKDWDYLAGRKITPRNLQGHYLASFKLDRKAEDTAVVVAFASHGGIWNFADTLKPQTWLRGADSLRLRLDATMDGFAVFETFEWPSDRKDSVLDATHRIHFISGPSRPYHFAFRAGLSDSTVKAAYPGADIQVRPFYIRFSALVAADTFRIGAVRSDSAHAVDVFRISGKSFTPLPHTDSSGWVFLSGDFSDGDTVMALATPVIPDNPVIKDIRIAGGKLVVKIAPRIAETRKVFDHYQVFLYCVDAAGRGSRLERALLPLDSADTLASAVNSLCAYRIQYSGPAGPHSLEGYAPMDSVLARYEAADSLDTLLPVARVDSMEYGLAPLAMAAQASLPPEYDVWTAGGPDDRPFVFRGSNALPKAGSTQAGLIIGSRGYTYRPWPPVHASLAPVSDTWSKGWNLVANPFPFPLAKDNLGGPQPRHFWTLGRDGGKAHWVEEPDTLRPGRGYAVYADRQTALDWNPLLWNPPKKAGAAIQAPRIEMEFRAGGRTEGAIIYRRGEDGDVPRLPNLGPGPAMRLGDGPGWAYLGVDSLDRVDLPLALDGAGDGPATLAVHRNGADTSAFAYRLVPESGGTAGAGATNGRYRLLAGSPAFVAARSAAWRAEAGAPELGPNLPNPFRTMTFITYHLPAGVEPWERVRLRVLDLRGRVLRTVELGAPPAGAGKVALANPGWAPGVYALRLEAERAGRSFQLQRKMVVAP